MAAPRHAVRVNPRFPVRVNMADPYSGAPDNIALAWNLFQPDPIVGPEPVFSVASANYDENGNNIGLNPRIDPGKGLWMGPQVANLFAGDSSQARSVTLTAQPYTLFVWSGSAYCSYGAATPGNPLKFTATAGATVFTPTGVSKWLLVAGTFGDMPYVPPGATQPSNAATTGGNGTNIPLDAGLLECFQGKADGVELVTNGTFDSGLTTGWTGGASAVLSVVSGAMRVENTAALFGYASIPISTIIGQRYAIKPCKKSSNNVITANYHIGNSPGSAGVITAGDATVYAEFVATKTVHYISLYAGGAGVGNYTDYDNISIQRLMPAVCSTVDRFCFGFSSAQVSADTALRSVRNVTTDVLYVSSGGVIKSSDGANTATVTVAGGWSADQRISLYRRTNGTQMQVGYRKSGETAITWGALVAYDGSDNPGTHERCCLNAALPIWGQAKSTANKYCTDSELLEMEALAA